MGFHHGVNVEIEDQVAVGKKHVFLIGMVEERHDAFQSLDPVAVNIVALAEGREYVKTLALSRQVPRLAGAQMVHQ